MPALQGLSMASGVTRSLDMSEGLRCTAAVSSAESAKRRRGEGLEYRVRSWRVLLFLCLALPGLAAAAERVTVQLNWKHQFEFAAFYAALEMGYYRDAGLDVTVLEGGPGVDVVQEVTEGRADFGVGTSALVVEHHEGKPVVALASMMQHSPIALLALRRSGVNSVHDLAGKPVAVDPHSRDEIDAYMRAAGIPADQIRFVDQTDWTLQSLEEGKVTLAKIDKAVRSILEMKYRLGLFEDPYRYSDEVRQEQTIYKAEFMEAARDMARELLAIVR